MTTKPNSNRKKSRLVQGAQTTITQAEVVTYLETHPQFFVDKHALLSNMTLSPMQHGNVYNFTACQVTYLQENNQQLRDKNGQLFDLVQHNQRIMAHTQEVVDACLSATNREVLIECFRVAWSAPFDLPAVVLMVSEKKPLAVLAKLLTETRFEGVYCGTIAADESHALFGTETIASVILSRFQYKKNQQVVLAIGSKDERHFHNQLDTSAFRLVQSVFQFQFNRLPVV